ncbi:PREDICTED: cysteine-rich and transmembrane domain-containing protein A-like [Nicotiana attenuata]|uniref:cysteine-rich and transmembrane domain-containing protein A-like n=1 Tax=Nicotiana attenuata TaxID=49451 RepID=UPI0009046408|nr:PREDICTED: cysteine-rich and transmembrane domain-containing protein A-like [Nicotiana attenuata]
MNSYDQNQAQATAYTQQQQPQGGALVAPPPPAGYPTRDVEGDSSVPVTTQSRGDGFWKGCCAALCCCCVLDACF